MNLIYALVNDTGDLYPALDEVQGSFLAFPSGDAAESAIEEMLRTKTIDPGEWLPKLVGEKL